ncbi:glycosyltransferase family 2 protein [Gloeothece verrucosa]|uniref:Glycosyl transferase family 2 n=1 Tax=Gloeothece verrucosa (strain PCC 7822) TaxID=497965 RepID=E0UDF5_GLOV7|nr:glycosyltransferase family 2 protein [Gloeothece verrucosa]ADN14146.1 glycosyl transferase family 2 [Gloeothece verrucosa PCC 7822]
MLKSQPPCFYFLIVNYYCTPLISRLMASLRENQVNDFSIVIVNNSPDDEQIRTLKSENIYLLEAKKNLGFGKACNLGLNWIYAENKEAIVWLINPDAYLLPDSLPKASQFFVNHPEISLLGTEVYEPSGKIWFGWGKFSVKTGEIVVVEESLDYQDKPYLSAQWVTGCSLLINLKQFQESPYFDTDYFLYYEDFDFCQRYAKGGHLIAITNQIKVIHEASSITLKYGYLRLIHNIYSYLLSLEKHTNPLLLWGRFIRMIFMSLVILPLKPKFALAKLQGIFLYCQRFINLSFIDKQTHVKNFN